MYSESTSLQNELKVNADFDGRHSPLSRPLNPHGVEDAMNSDTMKEIMIYLAIVYLTFEQSVQLNNTNMDNTYNKHWNMPFIKMLYMVMLYL